MTARLINIDIDSDRELADFRRDLRKLDSELAKNLTKELRRVIEANVVPAARSKAAWSSRIPGNIKPMVQARRLGVRVASKGAPHARPFEGLSKGELGRHRGSFRHPLFGDTDQWFSQPTRPFLAPAMLQNADNAARGAVEALDQASRQAGWS